MLHYIGKVDEVERIVHLYYTRIICGYRTQALIMGEEKRRESQAIVIGCGRDANKTARVLKNAGWQVRQSQDVYTS